MKKLLLNEDLFDDEIPEVELEEPIVTETEIEPEGPELGLDTGISNLIHELIIEENQAIQSYNSAAANMEEYPELVEIMHNIASEEFAHIGELQKALEMISPNASNIVNGEQEVELEESLKLNESIDLNSYDDGYVEFMDGEPLFVYGDLSDAANGLIWDGMGDAEHGRGTHKYTIMKWENKKLVPVKGYEPIVNESLKESFDEYNGYKLQQTQNAVLVRDTKGKLVGKFVSDEEAREFIDELGEE